METRQFTLIDSGRAVALPVVDRAGELRIPSDSFEATLGWSLQPSGLCRGEVCVPVADRGRLVDADGLDLRLFAELLGRPLAADADEAVVVIGEAAATRAERLTSLEAPDFTLPDLAGQPHSLSEQRGKKVLLVTWASW